MGKTPTKLEQLHSATQRALVDSAVLMAFYHQLNANPMPPQIDADMVQAARELCANELLKPFPQHPSFRNEEHKQGLLDDAMDLVEDIEAGEVKMDDMLLAALTNLPRRSPWVGQLMKQTAAQQGSSGLGK